MFQCDYIHYDKIKKIMGLLTFLLWLERNKKKEETIKKFLKDHYAYGGSYMSTKVIHIMILLYHIILSHITQNFKWYSFQSKGNVRTNYVFVALLNTSLRCVSG